METMSRIRRRRLHTSHSALAEDFIDPKVPRRERLRRLCRALILDAALVVTTCAAFFIAYATL